MPKIYCVEDDEGIRELVIYALENNGFQAEGFEEGTQFLAKVKESIPDLVILDIMLPGENGWKILEILKDDSKLKDIPVIMLTAKSAEYDKVRGLNMGADDYITKPFGVMELISRVRAVLRRTNPSTSISLLSLNGVEMDYDKRRVTKDGELINLTYKEFELLYYLLKNQDIVLSREALMNHIWGYDFEGETRTVDVHIANIRQKLGSKGEIIQTIRNVGYKAGSLS
ncbi:MAG: response regulator transcription factor [Clostridium sp.]|nr:response regulator transcription factor [Clostridium sp.]